MTKKINPYTILDSSDGDPGPTTLSIRLDEGEYKGVVYRYNVLKFADKPDPNGNVVLSIDFTVEQLPPHLEKDTGSMLEIEWSDEFKEMVGDIAMDIISNELGINEQCTNDSK